MNIGSRLVVLAGMFVAFVAAPVGASSDSLSAEMLRLHNAERAAQGLAPLAWDDALAEDAAGWADHLARHNRFEHAPQANGRARQGENLSMGWGGNWDATSLAQMWVDEKAVVKSGRFPDVGRGVSWSEVGHYTQMIWPSTTHVGCALAKGAGGKYLVCRYSPAGNVIGTAFTFKPDRQR